MIRTFLLFTVITFLTACVDQRAVMTTSFPAKSKAQANVKAGLYYLQKSDFVSAQQALEMALKQAPYDPNVLAAMATYYEKSGEPDKAGQYYAKAVLINPQSTIARRNYANFLYRYGYYQESAFYSTNLPKYY